MTSENDENKIPPNLVYGVPSCCWKISYQSINTAIVIKKVFVLLQGR